jgi:hypothetical protein
MIGIQFLDAIGVWAANFFGRVSYPVSIFNSVADSAKAVAVKWPHEAMRPLRCKFPISKLEI